MQYIFKNLSTHSLRILKINKTLTETKDRYIIYEVLLTDN